MYRTSFLKVKFIFIFRRCDSRNFDLSPLCSSSPSSGTVIWADHVNNSFSLEEYTPTYLLPQVGHPYLPILNRQYSLPTYSHREYSPTCLLPQGILPYLHTPTGSTSLPIYSHRQYSPTYLSCTDRTPYLDVFKYLQYKE